MGGPLIFGNSHIKAYSHPEVDRVSGIQGMYKGSFKDHILSTPAWLQIITNIILRYMIL